MKLFEGLAAVFREHPGCCLRLEWDFCDTYKVACVCKPSPELAAEISQLNMWAKELKDRYGQEPPRRDSRALDCTRLMFQACMEAACGSVPVAPPGPIGGVLKVYMCVECMPYDEGDKLPSWWDVGREICMNRLSFCDNQ